LDALVIQWVKAVALQQHDVAVAVDVHNGIGVDKYVDKSVAESVVVAAEVDDDAKSVIVAVVVDDVEQDKEFVETVDGDGR
jgi:hypothetical protein